ncbi:MAG: TolC family protein [Gammaproteobacteria bacterium]|nr:TolC family protein [Gammaproteobacteria bacterium]
MNQRLSLILIVAGVALAAPSLAAGPITLDDAVRMALENNNELRAADNSARAASDRAKGAWGAALPQVNARYMARRSDNPLDAFADKLNTRSVTSADLSPPEVLNTPDASTIHATQLSVELPLFTGGRIRGGIREAGAYADAARLAYEHRREATAFRTQQAYRAVQASQQMLAITTDAVTAAREHAETTGRLARQGRIVASDRLTAELNLSASESAREQAARAAREAQEQLRILLGLPANAELAATPWEKPRVPETAVDLAESEKRALAARRDLQSQEAFVKVHRARMTQARSVFLPQVSVVATDSWYDRNAALENKSQAIMGMVSFNLFSGGRDYHAVRAAQHETDEAEERLAAVRQGVHNDVRGAASRLTEARARVKIAEESVAKAQENVRLIKQRYGEGRTILVDLLMSERMLIEARSEALHAALAEDMSWAELRLAEGRLLESGVTTPN